MRANLANCPLERLPTPGSFWAVALLAIASAALPWNARANLVTSGTSITVDSNVPNPWTSAIGSGPSTATGTTVDLLPNAQVVVGNASAISLADNANITVAGGALIQNHAVSTPGPYGDGGDTVAVHNNSTITVNAGGQILATGPQNTAEAINPEGTGNIITNYGTIRATHAAAIWFQNTSGGNTVINEASGVIQGPSNTANVMGASGNGSVNFTNKGTVIGSLIFAGGDDQLHIYTGSTISGSVNGGGGNNLMTLNGTGTGSMSGALTNFQTLIKQDSGTWTLSGSIGNNGGSKPLAVEVQNGTLVLSGSNTNFNGTMLVDPQGVLQAPSQSLPSAITANGQVQFTQTTAGTYTGLISGTGSVVKLDSGTLTLLPSTPGGNTYSGGTFLNAGVLAVGADNALGAPTGGLTFSGGTLQLTNSFNLAATRQITLNAPGGTIDTNGNNTTISQGITGAGQLTKLGAGILTLTGTSSYSGGTTIAAGTLQLGNGGTSGSIVGNVADNGTLVFNRSDALTLDGVISGTGTANQAGTGTTILTGDNTYTGGTTISAGTLQLGNGGTSGSIVGNVADNGTFVFNRSDMLTLNGVISGTGTVNQIGAGTTILTGNNSYSGGTSVTNGTLEANSATALGTGAVVVNGQSSILNTAGTQITNSGTPNQNAASVLNGGTLSMQGGSIQAVAGNALVVGGSSGGPNTVQISGASISSPGSAILAQGTVDTNIVLSNGTTVNAGNGLIFEGKSSATTSLTANASVLSGNIQVTNGTANVTLNNSKLSGWVNQNTLTGASGVSPNDPAGAFANLPPANVNLSVDPSTWTIQASSTLNSLTLGPGSQVIFTPPSSPTGPFKTLVVNNLSGAGTFAMNTDIPALKGDLLVINKTSQGNYLVSINNQPQGIDGPANKGLLVVQTADGQATFQGQTEAGTFKERLLRGKGTAVTPDPKSWYLVREDQPVSDPSASSQPSLVPVSRSNALTNTANAAIASYSAAVPLYYTDMQTLVQRLGELRLSIQAPVTESAEQPPSGKGVLESKQVTPPPVPPTDEWGAWVRGFGSGTRIDNSGSRTFDQNAGGFQIGADKRVSSLWSGDLYLGIFGGYVYASRDFRDGGEGSANEMSLGAYTTWIHPNGWYADLVVKYSQMWNYFRTPNLNGSISTADYDVPALGGSLEVGKRFDLGRGLFFIEPQAQLAAVWIDGGSYGVSNGLRVSGDNQTSLQGRLGGRAGMHIDLSQQRAFELYLKAEAIQEFLTGNTVTTNSTPSDSNLSGTVGRFGGGVTAKVSRSTYLYAEYDYATGDHFQQPWFVNVGLRWQW
jgi:outer membrane autotransporter protein